MFNNSLLEFLSLFFGEGQRFGTKRHTSKALAQYLWLLSDRPLGFAEELSC